MPVALMVTDKRGVSGLLVHILLQWFADAGEDPRRMAIDRLYDLKNVQRLFAERHLVRTVHLHKGIGDVPFSFFHIDVAPAELTASPGRR